MSRFRSIWQASINATKRAFAWNFEDLMPPRESILFSFNSKDELKRWHLYSDSEYGGLSSASLEIKEDDTGFNGIFSGNLSLDVVEGSPWRMKRSGFCGMRSKKIYTDNWINFPGKQEDNSWQAFVYAPKDEWHEVKIPLEQYLPTWRGNVIDIKLEMNPARIVGMSLSVNAEGGVPGAKSGPGEFKLEIDCIKASRAHQN